MKSLVVKRSIVIAGHKTSVSLEDAFWGGLKEIAHRQQMTLSTMVGEIDSGRQQGNCRRRSACSCSTACGRRFRFMPASAPRRKSSRKATEDCTSDAWRRGPSTGRAVFVRDAPYFQRGWRAGQPWQFPNAAVLNG
jgi:hypothetical protein